VTRVCALANPLSKKLRLAGSRNLDIKSSRRLILRLERFADVVLAGRLRDAITRLNPAIPDEAREEALRKMLQRDAPSFAANNRAFDQILRDRVPVEYRRTDGSIAGDHVRVIDFDSPDAKDWLALPDRSDGRIES